MVCVLHCAPVSAEVAAPEQSWIRSFSRTRFATASAMAELFTSHSMSTPSWSIQRRASASAASCRFWWSPCSTSTRMPRCAMPRSSTACCAAARLVGPLVER